MTFARHTPTTLRRFYDDVTTRFVSPDNVARCYLGRQLLLKKTRPLFVHFRPFLNTMINMVQLTINGKSVDGVLGIQTSDSRMEGINESTELWWPPQTSVGFELVLRE